jgi:hypothetical protein
LSTCSRVKWVVSSRNWQDIEDKLRQVGCKTRLSLELNAESVSVAIEFFIQRKVSELAEQRRYDKDTCDKILNHLTTNADNTFLWVALVFQDLNEKKASKRHIEKRLENFPSGLEALYERMLKQVDPSDDAELCRRILALITTVYRPIKFNELIALVEP